MFLRTIASLSCTVILATAGLAQMGAVSTDQPAKPLASPPATASITLRGKSVTIKYNAPSMRGRKIVGELVPYDKVWRTGANPATTLITETPLKIGTLDVPAGTYTIYTLPSADQWLLIINKQTGQWGTEYDPSKDLGRVPMKGTTLPSPQEKMSISFGGSKGPTTDLHIRWETTDESVEVTAE